MSPPSQKNRPIGFYLEGGGSVVTWNFVIRPEDLTRQEPSRVNVTQTLGGAWADVFDRGIANITLAGHTGWRGGVGGDGAQLFADLRDTVFVQWHQRRNDAIKNGRNPDEVALFFADTLDDITARVAPRSFLLRRSKSRPLLMSYQIQLAVLGDGEEPAGAQDAITGALFNPLRWVAAKLGLENLYNQIADLIKQAKAFTDEVVAVVAEVCAFVQAGVRLVLDAVDAIQGTVDDITRPIFSAVQMVAGAARNGFGVLAAVQSSAGPRSLLMRAASTMGDIACTISNGWDVGRYFRSYDDLFGASNCSSTGGGREWSTYTAAGQNPFNSLYPPVASRVAVPSGASALATLQRDPLTMSPGTASTALAALPNQVSFG